MSADVTALARSALCGELEKLRDQVRELAAPLDEARFWTRPLEPGNSFGHLVLHLTGNVNHFVGAQLGGSGYQRDREREFTETDHPTKEAALARLDEAAATFRRVVEGLSAEQLTAPHPTERFGAVLPALLAILTHFALHRGQMSYIKRLVQPDPQAS
jgi:uncharacterized damage-inducible protein DinB